MSRSGPLRSLIAGAITLAVIVVVALLLMATDTLLSVYQRLVDIAPALGAAFLVVLSAAAVATGYTVWRLLRPRPAVLPRRRTGDIPDRGDLDARIRQGEALGVATAEAASELQELDQRRAGGEIHIVLFGEASSGKSTLIQALLPDARVATDPRRGTTTAATRYRWQDNQGNAVELVDLPGFGQAEGGGLADLARDEAIRAHLVIHVCESDLTRSQFDQVEALSGFGKPVIVAINKSDR